MTPNTKPEHCKACGRAFPRSWCAYCSNDCRHAPAPAVYRFVAPDGRVYVDSRADVRKREQIGMLPSNPWIAAALALYPAETWTFELLRTFPPGYPAEPRLLAEQRYIERYRSWDPARGFNANPADPNSASAACREAYRQRVAACLAWRK